MEEAINTINKAILEDPEFKEAYFMLGNIYLQESYYTKAKETFEKLNHITADDRKALYLIATSDFLSYNFDGASKNLEKILLIKPNDLLARNYLALIMSRKGKNKESLDQLMTIIKYNLKNEGDFSLYSDLAGMSFNMDLITPTLEDMKEITENNIKNPYSNIILGWFSYNDNALNEAYKYLKNAVELLPDDPVAHYLLGLVNYNLKDAKGAVMEYEKAYSLDAKFVKAIQERLQYIEQAKKDKQILEWEKQLTLDPKKDKIMFDLSTYYYKRGSSTQALDLIQRAIKIKPGEGSYYNLLGEIYANKYDWSNALVAFKKACELDKSRKEYWGNVCYASEKTGLYKEAVEAGKRALPKGNNKIYTSMAISYFYLEDYDSSIEFFKKALQGDSKNGELFFRYAIALQLRGSMKEALENYKKTIELMPELIDSYYYLGNTLITLGNYEESTKYFQKVLDMRSNYKSIYAPDFNETRVNLAQTLLEQGKTEKAIEHLDIVIKEDPLNARAHLFKAYAYENLKKIEDARKEYLKTFSLISNLPVEYSKQTFLPYSDKTVFIPLDKPVIAYSITTENRWTELYLGEPQFVLNIPERKEEDIKNDINKEVSNYKLVLELIEFYLYERRPDDALKKLLTLNEEKIGKFKMHNLKGMIYTLQGKTDLALIDFNKALEINPENYEIHNNLAVVYQIMGNYNPAIEHLNKSIKENFLNTWAYNNLGMIYNTKKNYTEAEESFYFAKVSDLQSPWARHNLAWSYMKLNKFEEAIKEMKKAINLSPEEVTFHSHLGWIYQEKGDRENALTCYKKALTIDPAHANLYNSTGVIFSDEHKYTEAIKNYKKALALAPQEELYQRNLGITYYKMNRYKEATKEFEKALKINYYAGENHLNLSASLSKQGLLEEGNSYLKNAVSYNQREYDPLLDLMILNNQGALYLEQGKTDLAENQFKNIILYKDTYKDLDKIISNCYVDTYNNLAILRYKQGEIEEAIKILERAEELIPEYPDTLNNMAYFLQEQDRKKSKTFYEKAITIQPANGIYYNNLGVLYLKESNTDKAIDTFNKGIRKENILQLLHYNLGGAYLAKNLFEQAEKELKNIPDHSHIAPEANYYLGLIYFRKDKKILAEERFQKAISLKKVSDNLVEAGWILLSLKAYDLAIEKFKNALEVNPDNVSACAGVATCYFNMDNMQRVKEEAEKGIKIDSKSEKPYIIRALAYYHSKEFDKALQDLEKAIKLSPENNLALYNYAYLLQEHNDRDKAIKTYQKIISRDKNSTLSICAEGFIFLLRGEYERARKNAYRVIQKDQSFSDAYYILGKIAEKHGNKSQAMFEYKRALKIDPQHVEAREGMERVKSEKY